jgi:RNA polymerase sigma-70 factor (ECF subfamily)
MSIWNSAVLDSPSSIDAPSDEALMVRVMEGDRDAFSQIYERHAGRIRGFVSRYVGTGDVADDLTQEIFLKVYRRPAAFDPRSRFLTWLYAVARNASIDHLRLRRLPTVPIGTARGEDDAPQVEPADDHQGPDEVLLNRELKAHLLAILDELSPKLKEVFLLCAVEGLSYEEAAQILNCPMKTVSSRLSRARSQVFVAYNRFLRSTEDRSRP